MTELATKILDVSQLLRVIGSALAAGIGFSLVFSLVIYGYARAGEHRQHARSTLAGAHAALATVALLSCLAAVAFGVTVMLSK
jgi:Na+-translocating ferredoxin:NAD+ oxidoreductase RnfA subunit